ncbi:hypothetical protein J6I75_09800 [Pseudidiomarina sp. 1APP75-27a]|uniref:hypothetical protein n=1 Tax=Pseudidiomarina terrestris TaxID=2820060 RepID=UPI002B053CE1|nr:hypothetical protein [Pseudidiomarina sp. 1APP75-27a]MEA3588648.1 hypothetical protein [Pseudidiomarina sp. 1APP75-27a]
MFKKVLKGLGIAILSLITLFVIIGVWSTYKSSAYETTAIPYLDVAIPEISTWEKPVMKSYFTPSVLADISEKDLDTLVRALSKMGKLVELGQYEFSSVTSKAITGGGSGTFVTYVVPATYENGDATLTVTLKEEDDSFSVYEFNLNSMALLE